MFNRRIIAYGSRKGRYELLRNDQEAEYYLQNFITQFKYTQHIFHIFLYLAWSSSVRWNGRWNFFFCEPTVSQNLINCWSFLWVYWQHFVDQILCFTWYWGHKCWFGVFFTSFYEFVSFLLTEILDSVKRFTIKNILPRDRMENLHTEEHIKQHQGTKHPL